MSDLSRTIIGGVIDEYEVADDDGERRFRLVKRNARTITPARPPEPCISEHVATAKPTAVEYGVPAGSSE